MKFQEMIPICYWPTTSVLIDDEGDFITSTHGLLARKGHAFSFTKPEEGIQFINKNARPVFSEKFISIEEDEDESTVITSNLNLILDLAFDLNRYDLISMLIMDYNLPQGNGIDYINQLKSSDMKKLLLTGNATPDAIIQAFNNRKIDQYLAKSDATINDRLLSEVELIKNSFFIDASKNLLRQGTKLYALLSDENFIAFFNKVLHSNKIREFYLLDKNGSFLLIDKDQNKKIFICAPKEEAEGMKLFFESCLPEDSELLDDINHFRKISFLYESTPSPSEVESYCYDCREIPGTDLLYSITSDIEKYDFTNNVQVRDIKK